MLRKTHAACGVAVTTMIFQNTQIRELLLLLLFALIGSLLPDIDTKQNIVKRIESISFIALLSILYIYLTGNITPFIIIVIIILFAIKTEHRTFTHSLIGLLSFSSCMYFIYIPGSIAFSIGYGMHIFMDALTVTGVELFYPFNRKKYGFKIYRTGGSEDLYFCIAAGFAFLSALI